MHLVLWSLMYNRIENLNLYTLHCSTSFILPSSKVLKTITLNNLRQEFDMIDKIASSLIRNEKMGMAKPTKKEQPGLVRRFWSMNATDDWRAWGPHGPGKVFEILVKTPDFWPCEYANCKAWLIFWVCWAKIRRVAKSRTRIAAMK